MQFKIGDKVKWGSQAGGYFKSKVGVIVQIVAANDNPHPLPKHYGGGTFRGHESYIVDCAKPGRNPDTYWPVVNKLSIADGIE